MARMAAVALVLLVVAHVASLRHFALRHSRPRPRCARSPSSPRRWEGCPCGHWPWGHVCSFSLSASANSWRWHSPHVARSGIRSSVWCSMASAPTPPWQSMQPTSPSCSPGCSTPARGEVRLDLLELRLLVEARVLGVQVSDAVEVAVGAVSPCVHPSGGHPQMTVDALASGELPLNRVGRRVEVDRIPVLLDGDRLPQVSESPLAGMVRVVLVAELVEVRLRGDGATGCAQADDETRGDAFQRLFVPGPHGRIPPVSR